MTEYIGDGKAALTNGQRVAATLQVDGAGDAVGTESNPLRVLQGNGGLEGGIQITSEDTPLTQIGFQYGVPSGAFLSTTAATGGTVTGSDGQLLVSTGTSVGGYAVAFSARTLKLRRGQGIRAGFAHAYATPVADSVQLVGPQTAEDGVGIGYNGTQFGVFRKVGGVREIRRLTITTGTGGAETLTITLNGVAQNVSISGALGTTALASAISEQVDWTGVGGGWRVSPNGATLDFVYFSAGALAGAFSFSSTGTAAASFSTLRVGETGTDVWTDQADFSLDPLDGTGASGVTIDPLTTNRWEIRYTETEAIFYVERPDNGTLLEFHRVSNTGSSADSLFQTTTWRLQAIAYSQGSTTDITLRVTGMSAFCLGQIRRLGARRGASTFRTGVGTSFVPLITIATRSAFGDPDRAFLDPVYIPSITVGADGNRGGEFQIILNATLTGAEFSEANATGAVVVDESATAFSGGVPLPAGLSGRVTAREIDLREFDLELYPGSKITIVGRALASTTDLGAAINWIEDRG